MNKNKNNSILAIGLIAVLIIAVAILLWPKQESQVEEPPVPQTEIPTETPSATQLELTLEEVAEMAELQGTIIQGTSEFGASLTSGQEVARLLRQNAEEWQLIDAMPAELPAQYFTLYINLRTKLTIQFFAGDPALAVIAQEEARSIYHIPSALYQTIEMMHMVKSYHVPQEVVEALTGGQRTTIQSVNDVPNEPFERLTIGQSGYYLYEKGGKYYLEAPYEYIDELTKAVYDAAMPFVDREDSADGNVVTAQLEPYSGSVDGFKTAGTLIGGEKVLFKSQGFYNKLEKGTHILLETDSGRFTLMEGLPGKPVISLDGLRVAYVDVLEFEAKGDAYIYDHGKATVTRATHYLDADPSVSLTAKDVLWLDDEHLLIIAGFDVGTVTQGGDIYRYTLADQTLELAYKAEKDQEIANMEWEGDQIKLEIVYWTDSNFINYEYKEQYLTPAELR